MKLSPNEKWILLGARRGLGKSFLDLAATHPIKILASSRIIEPQATAENIEIHRADFSSKESWPQLLEHFWKFSPTRIFYFAGGGPYGRFEDKAWKDHEWALRVNFEFPAFLLYQALRTKEIQQITLIGSSIAESSPDPLAASYSAAKHALKGLVSTVQSEQREWTLAGKGNRDIRLFSPGYMDTSLLPLNAWPRQQKDLVHSTHEVSKIFFDWIQNSDDANAHLAFPK